MVCNSRGHVYNQGHIDPPKAGRGQATLVHPVEAEMLAVTKFKSRNDTV